jgi:hypothetical protein
LKIPHNNKEAQKKVIDEIHNGSHPAIIQKDPKKISAENFLRKFEKIMEKAKKLLNSVIEKETSISLKNQTEIIEKIANIHRFVYDKSNKKEILNGSKENFERPEMNCKKETKISK